ncbi:MAG: proton-conducting transporter membrane subunit [Candidatus Bipolaricaulota bacterium]|nr:proton-conducting transporter membrane subunit [Candidatus Bipolaricaulota bacterium]
MGDAVLMLVAVFAPLAGAFLLPLLGIASLRLRNLAALAFVVASLVASLLLVPGAQRGEIVSFNLVAPLGLSLSFTADALAVFMAIVSSLVGAIIMLFSFDYISHYENQNEYYVMAVVFLGAMMGLVFSTNLVYLYVFWEITGIASWRLIGFYRGKADVLKADKAFLITAAGALVMLVGVLAVYGLTGTFDLSAMKGTALPLGVSALLLAGLLSKSATLPFQTWLPDAGVAPSPVTALLHAAVLVKIGVYVFARLFLSTFAFDEALRLIVASIAGASALVSAGAALVETDFKRIVAYSTVSQIGFIFLGFAMGNAVGAAGALLYILMHGLAKAGLFLSAGIVEQNAGTKDITKLGGLIRSMPWTAGAFLLCAFSVMGIPPFGGFFGKYMVLSAAVSGGEMVFGAVFLAGALLTILYLFRLFSKVFLGEPHGTLAQEKSRLMVACVVLLAALSLLGGLAVGWPSELARVAVSQMLGVAR